MIRIAQLLLVIAAGALWAASRLTWVEVSSFNGLGQPKTVTLSGGGWSTLLVPLAAVLLAAAVAAFVAKTWRLRLMAVVIAAISAVLAYLAISLWAIRDAAVRAAHLADVPVADLVGTQRHYGGAVVTLFAAVVTLVAAVLFLRSRANIGSESDKYSAPARRREAARRQDPGSATSERMMWDALDEGRDPTDADNEGR